MEEQQKQPRATVTLTLPYDDRWDKEAVMQALSGSALCSTLFDLEQILRSINELCDENSEIERLVERGFEAINESHYEEMYS